MHSTALNKSMNKSKLLAKFDQLRPIKKFMPLLKIQKTPTILMQ